MKKMINYHTHTYRCGHAVGNEYEMIEAALHEGYQEIGMSCHIALITGRSIFTISRYIRDLRQNTSKTT